MNWSLYTADRSTHLKIVVVALSTALLISVMGIAATEFNRGIDFTMNSPVLTVIKAGAPIAFTDRDGPIVR
jgi:preprotein translocase subunit SecF